MGPNWSGTFTALVTPFAGDGSVDEKSLAALVDWQVESGVEGIAPCGTTGESATMTNAEHLGVVEAVVKRVANRTVVLAGIGGNNTRNVVELARRAEQLGVDGVLAVAPYYNKPTQAGMLAHFGAVADATTLPVILYNVPGRTASNILPETVLELAAHPNVAGIKEASGSLAQAMAIISRRPEGFAVLSGEDDLTLAMLCLGGDGVVSVASNEVPAQMGDMVRRARNGDIAGARAIHYELLGLMQINFIETNPTPVKAALAMMGRLEENYRLPLVAMAPENRAKLAATLESLGLIDSPA